MSTQSRQHIRWFRNSAPYINSHRGKTFVLTFGGDAARHQNFANIIHDIALLNSLGVRLILIHGSRPQITERLQRAGLEAQLHQGLRITDAAALEHVKDAAGSLRAQIEALLSMGLPNSPMQGSAIRVCSGNFVTAKPLGIVDGVDFHHTGAVRRVDAAGVRQHLDAGSIVLISPLGYSPTGEIFNLALEDIAVAVAAAIDADKLILFGEAEGIVDGNGELVRQCDISGAATLQQRVADTAQAQLLQTARRACEAGVERTQIVSYVDDCALLQELFTHDGSGTLVARSDFEQSRRASIDDVGGILELIEPLEREGILLKRSRELLETEIGHFRVLQRDGRILACAALYPYPEQRSGEIACIVTHPDYRGDKRGDRLLAELLQRAQQQGLKQVFVLTTQTAHWFLEHGFVAAELSDLPDHKQSLYNLQRNSKVFIKTL